jgi:hypothetical protein
MKKDGPDETEEKRVHAGLKRETQERPASEGGPYKGVSGWALHIP